MQSTAEVWDNPVDSLSGWGFDIPRSRPATPENRLMTGTLLAFHDRQSAMIGPPATARSDQQPCWRDPGTWHGRSCCRRHQAEDPSIQLGVLKGNSINSLQHQTSKAQQTHSTGMGMAMAPENHSAQGTDKKRDLVSAACALYILENLIWLARSSFNMRVTSELM